MGGCPQRRGWGCRYHTRSETVVQLENKLEWNFIFSSSEADSGSQPLYWAVTTAFHEKKPQTRGSNRPCVPISFSDSVLVLRAADQSLAWALAGLTGCLEGGHQVALPWPFLPLRHDMPVPAGSSRGGERGAGDATTVLSHICDEV